MQGNDGGMGTLTGNAPEVRQHHRLYEEVAGRIIRLIDQGTYRPGDRLPSVRQLSSQAGVSLSTVMEAYRRLEDRGRIRARPQSGYYVQREPTAPTKPVLRPAEPDISRPTPEPTSVTSRDLTLRVMRHHADPSLVPLGAAIPNPGLLPLGDNSPRLKPLSLPTSRCCVLLRVWAGVLDWGTPPSVEPAGAICSEPVKNRDRRQDFCWEERPSSPAPAENRSPSDRPGNVGNDKG